MPNECDQTDSVPYSEIINKCDQIINCIGLNDPLDLIAGFEKGPRDYVLRNDGFFPYSSISYSSEGYRIFLTHFVESGLYAQRILFADVPNGLVQIRCHGDIPILIGSPFADEIVIELSKFRVNGTQEQLETFTRVSHANPERVEFTSDYHPIQNGEYVIFKNISGAPITFASNYEIRIEN
ncbi:MAG: hypothetical protein Harvfovirus22_9 [Harvfovirus sp.]|uniref:Uncharacterized protein n=1 Tax=Harvfovirus sp. TaxID=2487768 RepID=A0A3G5A428_9VIRU|nr:MAG: hypothetical protein Harvfovirus22_9 [Harvfovirus sp.]